MTAPDLSGAAWKKSSYSNGEGGACVEVADNVPDGVTVRDTKSAGGPALVFRSEGWAPFVAAIGDGTL
ncbi:DUF397 domain-containing protein [Streptomyces sp. NPDC051569]|uniref:DUF397 domain-containing protein n=1 Tax=Streptomyces sp. NPDC051569 TaxID=3365661 RepID=UPI00379112CB